MESVSTRLDDETYETIVERAETRGSSQAEELRRLIHAGFKTERLEDEIERKDARIDELLGQLRQANKRQDETTDLARYVDETRSAGVLTRMKWWLRGRDK